MGAGAKVEDPPTGGDKIPPWRGKKCDNLSRDFGKQLTGIVRVISKPFLTSLLQWILGFTILA
jgi:hypothetical protein